MSGASHVWYCNGQPLPAGGLDRGLQFGDGLFETIAVRSGRALRLTRHLDRLEWGCERLGLPRPERRVLERELTSLASGHDEAVLKLIVTAGKAGRGYARASAPELTRYSACLPWPTGLPEQLSVTTCKLRLSEQPALAGVKHCNRLEQILARREVDSRSCDEGLLLDRDGRVVEGVSSNIFIVRAGQLITPELRGAGVAGIIRGLVLERAPALDIASKVSEIRPEDILEADEVFMCNSVMGIRPVVSLDVDGQQKQWEPGKLTCQLQRILEQEN
ncbi:aminodeoxychorismate lyase [Gammaproteobacteria bacterium AB-CW1]|uniref:Aminodeoxychorismate lyase n=1 Tax=Natronospira elongata TaxID=3110268 RepID=A0AAP6ML48_9GAMM|nr:aminodeoxychorismate lyase [Gammaproteobacteria bacterium AB-CW1]